MGHWSRHSIRTQKCHSKTTYFVQLINTNKNLKNSLNVRIVKMLYMSLHYPLGEFFGNNSTHLLSSQFSSFLPLSFLSHFPSCMLLSSPLPHSFPFPSHPFSFWLISLPGSFLFFPLTSSLFLSFFHPWDQQQASVQNDLGDWGPPGWGLRKKSEEGDPLMGEALQGAILL